MMCSVITDVILFKYSNKIIMLMVSGCKAWSSWLRWEFNYIPIAFQYLVKINMLDYGWNEVVLIGILKQVFKLHPK